MKGKSKPKQVGFSSRRRKEFSRRELRGLSIVAKGHMIRRTDESAYLVRSSDLEKWYKISWNGKRWVCGCKDYSLRKQPCKHIYAILFLSRLPYILTADFQARDIKCPKCGSNRVIRKGLDDRKEFAAQRYMCKDGGHKFTDKGESAGLKGNPLALIAVFDLYMKGLSTRAVADHLNRIYSMKISYPTVYRWVRRMIRKMKASEKNHSLRVGKTWHLDETQVTIAGQLHYLWNAMDAQTRILLASEVTRGRSSDDAEMVIRQAIGRAQTGLRKINIITDGLASYKLALTKGTYGCQINHISKPRFTDPKNNNLVERLNGTQKTRIRNFRRLGNKPSSAELFDGWRMYYNSKRPHAALRGKTPIEASSESKQKRI